MKSFQLFCIAGAALVAATPLKRADLPQCAVSKTLRQRQALDTRGI